MLNDTKEWQELREIARAMRESAQSRIRHDAWMWPHVPSDVLESVIGAVGEISVVEAREVLARLEAERA